MKLRIGRNYRKVKDLKDAQSQYDEYMENNGDRRRSSESWPGIVYNENDVPVNYISYNGRVWIFDGEIRADGSVCNQKSTNEIIL